MIVDLRIYTCLPNRVAEFVALYEEKGWPIQQKHLGNCVGWYTTIEGALNTIVHMWGYADQADRERRRAAMAADPPGPTTWPRSASAASSSRWRTAS